MRNFPTVGLFPFLMLGSSAGCYLFGTMKTRFYLLALVFLLGACSTGVPEFKSAKGITSKTSKSNIQVAGTLEFYNASGVDIHLVELNCDVLIDGSNEATAITRTTQPVYTDSNFTVPFTCNIPTQNIFDEDEEGDKEVKLRVKGVLKSRTDKKIFETDVDWSEAITLKGVKRDKEQDKLDKKQKKEEKKKKKLLKDAAE